jgi:hypothetical protein
MGLRDHIDDAEPSFLITVGFVLFIIPEPASSAFGIAMMLFGIVWWFDEWRDG